MKKAMTILALVIVSVCLLISLLGVGVYALMYHTVMEEKDPTNLDPEYAMLVATDEVVVKRFDVDQGGSFYFFADYAPRKTEFSNAIPKLTIINDSQYYVEVSANKSLADVIQIRATEKG